MKTKPLKLLLVEAFSLVCCISINAQVIEIPQLFVGHDILKEQYGITSHITWKGYDYDNYEGNLMAISECGIDKIRIDFNYGSINWGKGEANFTIWNNIYKEVYNRGLDITPIFFLKRDERYEGELAHSYNLYVQECMNRYGEKISEWEVGNEMDMIFSLDGKMPPIDYLALLKDTYQKVKTHNTKNTLLMGAIGDIGNGYFEELLKLKAHDFCDALSIHYYNNKTIPENIVNFYDNLNTTISCYSVKKPVWLTETGYCTFNDFTDSDLFYTEILPNIYKKLEINTKKAVLTLLLSPNESQPLYKQDNPAIYYGFNKCVAKEMADIKELNVKTNPVVMVLFGERFPYVLNKKDIQRALFLLEKALEQYKVVEK